MNKLFTVDKNFTNFFLSTACEGLNTLLLIYICSKAKQKLVIHFSCEGSETHRVKGVHSRS